MQINNATPKFFHWLEHSGHVVTNGPERAIVFNYACQFIDTITATAAGIALTDSVLKEVKDEK